MINVVGIDIGITYTEDNKHRVRKIKASVIQDNKIIDRFSLLDIPEKIEKDVICDFGKFITKYCSYSLVSASSISSVGTLFSTLSSLKRMCPEFKFMVPPGVMDIFGILNVLQYKAATNDDVKEFVLEHDYPCVEMYNINDMAITSALAYICAKHDVDYMLNS